MSATATAHAHEVPTNTGIPNKKLAMWAFLASDCMFFGTLISTHLIYRKMDTSGFEPTDVLELGVTSISTFVLLVSSYLMALAVSAMHRGNLKDGRMYLYGVISFGLVFLGFQYYEFSHFVHGKGWYEWTATTLSGETLSGTDANGEIFRDVADTRHAREHFAAHLQHDHPGAEITAFKQVKEVPGLTLQSDLYGSTFYVMTGTHGTHVAIGVFWLSMITLFSYKELNLKVPTPSGWKTFLRIPMPNKLGKSNALDVEVAGLYWHFVDIVWIVIFTAVYLFEFV